MKKRKLPPHQYSLRLPKPYKEVIIQPSKPHLVFYKGQWRLFRTRWKSRFRDFAAHIAQPSIPEIRKALPYQHDAYRYGYRRNP